METTTGLTHQTNDFSWNDVWYICAIKTEGWSKVPSRRQDGNIGMPLGNSSLVQKRSGSNDKPSNHLQKASNHFTDDRNLTLTEPRSYPSVSQTLGSVAPWTHTHTHDGLHMSWLFKLLEKAICRAPVSTTSPKEGSSCSRLQMLRAKLI